MALTPGEQEFFDVGTAALPHWFNNDQAAREFMGLAAKHMGAAKVQSDYWLSRMLILNADGVVGSLPDWLAQHARDRGTYRQEGEGDVALAERIRNIPGAVTRSALLTAIGALVASAGEPTAGIAMVEMQRDEAYLGEQLTFGATGGTFAAGTGGRWRFTPDTIPWIGPAYSPILSPNGRIGKREIVFSGAANAANNGAFETLGFVGNAVEYVNAGGAGVDATVTWSVRRYDWQDIQLTNRDDSYCDRGFRVGRTARPAATIIVMLPFGVTEPTRLAVADLVRRMKGAGVVSFVERRVNP